MLGRSRYAHRVYYAKHKGPIPPGCVIHHVCRVRSCVNPDHLEAVTQAENLRADWAARRALRSGPTPREEALALAEEIQRKRSARFAEFDSRKYCSEEDVIRAYEEERVARGVALGSCFCGCGQETTIVQRTRVRQRRVKGEPNRYVHSHCKRSYGERYVLEDKGYESNCWIWAKSFGRYGYGQVAVGGRTQTAHRAIYEEFCGPIPEGLHLHHLCGIRACVNPEHLRPVTPAENNLHRTLV